MPILKAIGAEDQSGLARETMVICGYTWLYVVICGYTWLYVVIGGYTWLYIVREAMVPPILYA